MFLSIKINRFTKFDQKLSENIAARNQTIQHLSSGARDAYNNWVGLRKKVIKKELIFNDY